MSVGQDSIHLVDKHGDIKKLLFQNSQIISQIINLDFPDKKLIHIHFIDDHVLGITHDVVLIKNIHTQHILTRLKYNQPFLKTVFDQDLNMLFILFNNQT